MVDKIAGRGMHSHSSVYIKKKGQGVKMTAAGSGLYLRPWCKGESVDNGMYLHSGSGYTPVGSGLLLGPNSPFASILF